MLFHSTYVILLSCYTYCKAFQISFINIFRYFFVVVSLFKFYFIFSLEFFSHNPSGGFLFLSVNIYMPILWCLCVIFFVYILVMDFLFNISLLFLALCVGLYAFFDKSWEGFSRLLCFCVVFECDKIGFLWFKLL